MASYGYGYGQYGAGDYNAYVVSRAFVGDLSVNAGSSTQLQVVDTYSNGQEISLAGNIWQSSNTNIALVTSDGIVYGISVGTVNISLSQPNGDLIGTVQFTVGVAATQAPAYLSIPTFLSHLTQGALNYFDWKDVRIRNNKYSIDAQFLNISMQQVQLSWLRLNREIKATSLHACPANIDNRGVYFRQQLPSSFNYSLPGHTVVGSRQGSGVILTRYQDELPVPARAILNPEYSPVPLSTGVLFSTFGTGISAVYKQGWSCIRQGPFTPATTNKILFWTDSPSYDTINVQIKITGQRGPTPAWTDARNITSESLTINNLGLTTSKFAWSYIDSIQILGLPSSISLVCYQGGLLGQASGFPTPQQLDFSRPYIDPMFRDIAFDRYWSVQTPGFLTETYMKSNYEGWQYAQSYSTQTQLSCVVCEPNTWGGFAASGTTLYYFDRREQLPPQAALQSSALVQEPYYGLNVQVDPDNVAPVYYVILTPVAYANADISTSYRYVVVTPDQNKYVITPDNIFAEYSPSAGWRGGNPTEPLSIPLAQNGTYIFTLQTSGSNGILYDSTPWQKFNFTPIATLDLSSIVPQIEGLMFDDRNRLWVWTGSFLVPVQLCYDGYIIDQNTQSIYLTDSVDGLALDGIYI